jgi:hypothetical protein
VEPPIYGTRALARRRQDSLGRTKGKVAKFLSTSDSVSLVNSEIDAPHHHCTDANVKYAAKDRTVNGKDLADILAIDIERGADGLGLKDFHQERKSEGAID